MAASITKGTSFTDGQQNVTVAQFNPLLTSATISGIDRENMDATVSVASYQSEAPDNPQSQEVWQDDWSGALRSLLAGAFVPGTSNLDSFIATLAVTAGQVICPDGTVDGNGVPGGKPCPQTKRFGAIGVATADVGVGELGQFVCRGPVLIQSTGTITAKSPVRVSATDGVVESAGAAGTGMGRECIGIALSDASGGVVWVNLKAR